MVERFVKQLQLQQIVVEFSVSAAWSAFEPVDEGVAWASQWVNGTIREDLRPFPTMVIVESLMENDVAIMNLTQVAQHFFDVVA